MGEEADDQEPSTELGKLLENDPKGGPVLAYLGFVSLALLGLGIATFKLGGQLMGLGFADDKCVLVLLGGGLGFWGVMNVFAYVGSL